jgi:hypothetical protein
MRIVPDSGYSVVTGAVDLNNPVQVVCSADPSGGGPTVYSLPFMMVPFTQSGLPGLVPITDLQSLSGKRDDPVGFYGGPSHYEWTLNAVSCGAAAAVSPQAPICGGAASLAESALTAQPTLTP